MYHVFFNTSTPYIKYLAVLLHSIIAHTQSSTPNAKESNAPYIFHVLLDSGMFDESSQGELESLHSLIHILNQSYPCELRIHDCAQLLAQIQPNPSINRVIYSRLFVANFVDESVEKCLYLDTDMLALDDVREIFVMEIGEKVLGVVRDAVTYQAPLQSRAGGKPFRFSRDRVYFNSGMLLINLNAWRTEAIEQKAVRFLQSYHALYFDQDALNAVIGDRVELLDPAWNFQFYFYAQYEAHKIFCNPPNPYQASFTNRKIIHYVCNPKPWESPYLSLDSIHLPVFAYDRDVWWDLARRTEPFAKELIAIEQSFTHQALESYSRALGADLQNIHKRIDNIASFIKNPIGFAYRKLMKKIARI